MQKSFLSYRNDALLLAVDTLGLLLLFPVFLLFLGFFSLWLKLITVGFALTVILIQGKRICYIKHLLPAITVKVWLAGGMLLLLGFCSALLPGYQAFIPLTTDSPKHVMIFKELWHNTWPVVHHNCEIKKLSCDVFLRFYLGYYLLPAGLAKIFNANDITWFIVGVQTVYYSALYICMAIIFASSGRFWLAVVSVGVFALFGDLGTLYSIITNGWRGLSLHNDSNSSLTLEYFASSTLMRWMPHQAITAFYGAVFFITAWELKRFSLADCAVMFLIVCVWGPIVALTVGLLMLFYVLSQPGIVFKKLEKLQVVQIGAIIVMGGALISYYATGSADIPRGIARYSNIWTALAVNLGPLALLAVGLKVYERKTTYCLLGMLCVLPLLRLGYYNDFVRYGSAPVLAVIKFLVLKHLLTKPPKQKIAICAVTLLLAICLVDGMNELKLDYGFSPKVMIGFDPNDDLFRFQRSMNWLITQYYAPCSAVSPLLLQCE